MTFREFLMSGFLGHYCLTGLTETAFAIVYGIGIVLCFLSYFLGSLNFSLIISKYIYHDDIRKYGSGNAGTTNMLRTFGRRAAAMTFVGDAVKAIISCAYGYCLLGYIGATIAGFFCILGHIFPIYYHFKGGKGIVTVAFMILMLDPLVFLVLFTIYVILIIGTRLVSLASIMCSMLYPLILYRFEGPGTQVIFAFLSAALVVFMHKDNMMRILNRKEPRIDLAALFGRKKIQTEATPEAALPESDAPTAEPATKGIKSQATSRGKQKRRRKQAKQERQKKA